MQHTEPRPAVKVINGAALTPVLFVCEHASCFIPDAMADLGVCEQNRQSHAVWDIGALDLAMHLSLHFDAPLVASEYSRLVYDCNRPPTAASAIPEKSETVAVPGNVGLSQIERDARADLAYYPFVAAVNAQIDRGIKAVVTIHSFTPVYFGQHRPTEIGILHDENTALADAILDQAPVLPHRRIARNDPYGPQDGVTHSLQIYGTARGIDNVMIEVRNDLVSTPTDVSKISKELIKLIGPALMKIGGHDA